MGGSRMCTSKATQAYALQTIAYAHTRQYGYVPYNVPDTSSVGRQTREASRTLEYSFEDFGIRQVAQLLRHDEDLAGYTNRSYVSITSYFECLKTLISASKWYRNVWDPSVESDGYKGFPQKRLPNGDFNYTDPIHCSLKDDDSSRECSLTAGE